MRPVFAKILELFTGGFSYTATARTNWSEGATLPKGTLLQVNELNRTCIPIKRGRLTAFVGTGVGTAVLQENHLFEVGDHIWVEGATAAKTIETVNGNSITVTDAWGIDPNASKAVGAYVAHVGTSTATGPIATRQGSANSIARYPSTVDAGASVTALRRGTVYSRRVAPVIGAVDNMPGTILFSNSR